MSKKRTHVKWIGPNEPVIILNRNNARLYLTKRELVDLVKEIDEFTDYYRDEFSEGRIDIETPPEDFSLEWTSFYERNTNGTTKT